MGKSKFGLLVILAAVACGGGESFELEEPTPQVLALQQSLETEGFASSEGPNFVPNPYEHERLIRSAARKFGLDERETDLLLVRMKENWDRKAETAKKVDRR